MHAQPLDLPTHPLLWQVLETQEAVFEMPAEPGQLPNIFAALLAHGGDDSDCEVLDASPECAPVVLG